MYKELGWEDLNGEGYYRIKRYSDFSKQDGLDYRLSVLPETIRIEKFNIFYGLSQGDSESNYNCNIVFEGKISNENDLKMLMGFLEIPVKNLVNQNKQNETTN